MAYSSADHHDYIPGGTGRSRLAAFLDGAIRVLAVNRSMSSRMTSIARLQAMTDEQLAAKGLKRDEIVHHVFRDILYI